MGVILSFDAPQLTAVQNTLDKANFDLTGFATARQQFQDAEDCFSYYHPFRQRVEDMQALFTQHAIQFTWTRFPRLARAPRWEFWIWNPTPYDMVAGQLIDPDRDEDDERIFHVDIMCSSLESQAAVLYELLALSKEAADPARWIIPPKQLIDETLQEMIPAAGHQIMAVKAEESEATIQRVAQQLGLYFPTEETRSALDKWIEHFMFHWMAEWDRKKIIGPTRKILWALKHQPLPKIDTESNFILPE